MFQPIFTEEMEAGAMYTKIVGSHDITDKMYADTAGPFPITSAKGNRYFRITYVVDANAILVVPMKDRQNHSMQAAWATTCDRLAASGIPIKLYILDIAGVSCVTFSPR